MVSFSAAFSAAVSPVILPDLRVAFFALFFSAMSGRHLLGDVPLLEDPDAVAEGIAEAHVGAVEVLDGLLGEVGDAALLQGLVQTPDVVRIEHEGAHRALGDQLTQLRSGGVVVQRRAWLLEEDLGARVTGDAHSEPTEGALLDVLALLQPELVDVEVERRLLVEDLDGSDVQLGDHRLLSPLFWRGSWTTL